MMNSVFVLVRNDGSSYYDISHNVFYLNEGLKVSFIYK